LLREAEHTKTVFAELLSSPSVVPRPLRVRVTVNFDHKPMFDTAEINNKALERVLPPKFGTANIPTA
jgi:hypothetical protein